MTDEDIKRRLDDGSRQFREMRKTLTEINKKLELIPSLQADVHTAKESAEKTQEIVEAWNALKTGGKFARWAIPIFVSLAGTWAWLKAGLFGFFK